MVLLEEHPSPDLVREAALETFAEQVGVDHDYAHDVVGAVLSYCQARHGTAALTGDYLSFLVARSAYQAQGDVLTADEMEAIAPRHLFAEKCLLRTLAVSSDPAALYEAYRRGLVRLKASALSRHGYVMQVNINKIASRSHENLSLLWLLVLKQIAVWVVEWREENPEIDTIVITTGQRREFDRCDFLPMMEAVLQQQEHRCGIKASRLLWA